MIERKQMMRGEPSTSKAQVTWHTACLAVAANTSYAPYIDKHAVKQFVRQQAPTLRLAATVEYWSNASDGSLATLAWRPVPSGVTELVLKASHLSGGVMLVRENATTCIKAPCRTGVGSRVLEAGTVLVGNQRARMALEASCRLWLAYSYGNHKVRLGTWSERPLYSNVPRGCLLEEAIERDLHGQKDIKVFCFAQQPAFVMVRPINRRFTRNATTAGGSSRGRGKDPEESIAYYTTGWRQLRMYEGHARAEGHVEGHARRAVVVEGHARPPYLQSLLDDATRLARGGGFDSVRVDFLASRDRYAFNELTFSHRGCAGGTFVPEPLDLLYGSLASAGPRGLEVEGSGGGGGGGGSIEEEQLRIIAEHERTHRWHCTPSTAEGETKTASVCVWVHQRGSRV